MVSLAQLIMNRAAAGLDVAENFDDLPVFQLEIWFSDLAPLCPSRIDLDVERRPANALNIEIGTPMPRCRLQSPDDRGSVWIMSGGSPLAYGKCSLCLCPRIKPIEIDRERGGK